MHKRYLHISPTLTHSEPAALRQQVLDCFISSFDCYEQLFELLADPAAWYEKAIPLRHPLIFYYGHTATFFTNKLVLSGLFAQRIDPRLESIFAVGVDEMSWDDLNEAHYHWPSVAEVKSYRDCVRSRVIELIETLPLEAPIHWSHPWWPIVMGIEHERIHLETSSVLIRQLPLARVSPHSQWTICPHSGQAPQNQLIDITAGPLKLGKQRDAAQHYGWDNEFGEHYAAVEPFKAARYLTSNQEFLSFVSEGGYTDPRWWDTEGAAWQAFAGATHPTFWLKKSGNWLLRTLTQEIPMPWDWPVEVNCHEARAWCKWYSHTSGLPVRLPTEDEWYSLLEPAGYALEDRSEPPLEAANLQLQHWASACPVNQFDSGGLNDVRGNVWQWTETPIYPFEGFEVHPLYDDFTTPTFDDRHNLMKGGSFISTGNESLVSARYAFRRHFFQHAGFRYVVSDAPVTAHRSAYETDRLLSEYAEFHYGDEYFGTPNFPKALTEIALKYVPEGSRHTALDLGCATGRASFELARHFDKVTGIDFSARFVGMAAQMAETGKLRYTLTDEGELISYRERRLDALGIDAAARQRTAFFQGDACNLKPIWTDFDFVLAANLIDRLYEPARFLALIADRIKPGGILMITSPYTWLTDHTPRHAWLGGYKRDGETLTTLDGLKLALGTHFNLLAPPCNVPFVIRETRRKFQHTLAEVSLWQKIR